MQIKVTKHDFFYPLTWQYLEMSIMSSFNEVGQRAHTNSVVSVFWESNWATFLKSKNVYSL